MKLRTVIILIVVVLFVVIMIQNTQVLTLRMFFWEISMSRIILIPLIMIVGFVLGYIVGYVKKKI